MTKQTIKLGNMEAAKDFVRVASNCNFDIDVYFNRIVLDAKSILGILSIDHRNPITVEYDGYNENFSGLLAKYAVK